MNHLLTFQQKFDKAFFAYLDLKIKSAKKIHPQGATLLLCLKEFIRNGGKRFRPALFYYAYESTKKKGTVDALKVSFVFELFHTFALIHDDIIDYAPLRRGSPTLNKKYGVATAVLAGDLALMLADEIFMDAVVSNNIAYETRKRLLTLYDAFKQELMVGQYLDFVHIADTGLIMLLKTSLYSFVRPAKFGFLFRGSTGSDEKFWDGTLERLGVLFQLKDDHEGVFGDEKTIGKSITSDVTEGKNTRITELFKEKATPKELRKFLTFFGKKSISSDDFRWYKKQLLENRIDLILKKEIRLGVDELIDAIHHQTDQTPFQLFVLELAVRISSFS